MYFCLKIIMNNKNLSDFNKNELGQWGEEAACNHLTSLGYLILERQWRFSKAEIDIIAKEGDVLVFVEVKTKSYNFFGEPEESISLQKEKLIIDGALRYMEKINHEWEIRFDIISILVDAQNNFVLKHFKDAFFPGLE